MVVARPCVSDVCTARACNYLNVIRRLMCLCLPLLPGSAHLCEIFNHYIRTYTHTHTWPYAGRSSPPVNPSKRIQQSGPFALHGRRHLMKSNTTRRATGMLIMMPPPLYCGCLLGVATLSLARKHLTANVIALLCTQTRARDSMCTSTDV